MLAAETKVVPAPAWEALRTTGPVLSWKQIIEPVEPFLGAVSRRLAAEAEAFDHGLVSYARYALEGHGKQLRPALVALTANALGRINENHVTVAVIIEMVHLATLVHDDVIDEAAIRRGRPTLAADSGNEIAVLFGDCLFANALTLAAAFPTTEVCRAVATATKTVCSGEILQLQRRQDFRLSRQEYFKVLEMKTAELFALSCELGAFLSGATVEQRKAVRQFGLALGTAYQVYDDCVDLFGTEAAAGKSLGTDLAKGKLTLPVLMLWERADAADRARVEKLVASWQAETMEPMARLLAKHGALEAAVGEMLEYIERARQAARRLPASDGQTCLLGLAEYLAWQTRALCSKRGNGV